ncbi:hypothetical protein KFK09_010559 [Dendrobium nobile]|uniref:Uncharacterized protein n=1 Tax=Dendrobium nobile TaxID=94219 RepID=A0A8T3BAB4_DENNO|nr:hypothetical protein KFK09_010559 [Dendrobium nobile]
MRSFIEYENIHPHCAKYNQSRVGKRIYRQGSESNYNKNLKATKAYIRRHRAQKFSKRNHNYNPRLCSNHNKNVEGTVSGYRKTDYTKLQNFA